MDELDGNSETVTFRANEIAWLMSAGVFAMMFLGLLLVAVLSRGLTQPLWSMGCSTGDRVALWFGLVGTFVGMAWSAVFLKPEDNWMKVEPAGFTIHTKRAEEFFAWTDIEKFGVLEERNAKGVIFTFSVDGTKRANPLSAVRGFDGKLPPVYNLRPREMCAYLNDRLKAGR
jgi:hypothetical protein